MDVQNNKYPKMLVVTIILAIIGFATVLYLAVDAGIKWKAQDAQNHFNEGRNQAYTELFDAAYSKDDFTVTTGPNNSSIYCISKPLYEKATGKKA